MKKVLIKEITLVNYRQFIDQKIEFKTDENKNITIIQGKNGFGKSNIFNAVTWCFFGVEQHLKPDERALPICNTTELLKLKKGASLTTSVKIMLDTDQGIKEIVRSVIVRKEAEGASTGKSELKITEQIGRNWKVAPYPDYIISKIVPRDMGHFFFIDGEKLRQLFENINPDVIKKSIFDLSQITLLQHTIDHFSNVKGHFRRTIKGTEPTVDLYEERLERLEVDIKADKTALHDLKKQRDDAFDNKKRLDDELEGIDNNGLKVLEERRKGLEADITHTTENLEEKQNDFLKYLFRIAPPLVFKKSIDETLEIMSKLEFKRKLPPKIEKTFVGELLEHETCICGRGLKVKDDASARKELEKLLAETDYSSIASEATTLRYQLKTLLGETEKAKDQIKIFEEKIQGLETSLLEKQKQLKEVNVQIGSIDVEKVRRVHADRQKYINALQECNGKIGRLDENIRFSERTYKDVEAMYKRELSKKEAHKGLNQKIDVCDQSIQLLETIKEKIMKEIKREIEKKTRECWCKLISAKKFENISIQDDYELRVEKDGFNAVTSLSAAETLCLGYSFMSSLRESSGFVVPIIIDTPLAKIDKEYRLNVADWLKEVLHDAQVVLLVTNAEYGEDFKAAIRKNVSQEFILQHDEKTGTSEVLKDGK